MSSVKFGQKDKELEEQISKFKEENGIEHFAEAVRILCREDLKIKSTINNSKLFK